MKNPILLTLFCIVCVGLSMACCIGADHIQATAEECLYHYGPKQHHMFWEWLRIAAWVFGVIPLIPVVIVAGITAIGFISSIDDMLDGPHDAH